MKNWYQGSDRVSDTNSLTAKDRPSYQAGELIEDDDERLAMRQGDTPPPLPKRVANPRIRDDQALLEFNSNSDKMHLATSDDAFKQTWLDYRPFVFPQSVGETGTNVKLFHVPTYQCSILLKNMGSFSQKSEFSRPENLNKPIAKGEKFNVADLSLLREFW